jgi:paraquat-inducible protein A
MDNRKMIACSGCDLLLEKQSVDIGQVGCCPRCGTVLTSPRKDSVNRTFAVSLTGLLLYIPAMFFPLISLDAMGMKEYGSIINGFTTFYQSGYTLVAIVVLLTSILLPLVKLLILFSTSFCLRTGYYPPILTFMLRTYHHLQEWGMDEVYLISLFVTLIKVYEIADISYEIGFFAFLGMVFTTVCLSSIVDMEYFWETIENKSAIQLSLVS